MTLLASENFNSGTAAGWTLSSITFVAGYSQLGIQCGSGGSSARYPISPAQDDVTVGFHMRLPTEPGTDERILRIQALDNDQTIYVFYHDGTDTLSIRNDAGTLNSASYVFDPATWYFVEIQLKMAVTGYVEVRVDGTQVLRADYDNEGSPDPGWELVVLDGGDNDAIWDDFYLANDLTFRGYGGPVTLCTDWTTEADVELCYTIPEGTDQGIIDNAITAASEILYALTGRQFPGTCSETLRPCGNQGDPYGFQPWLWTYPWTPLRYDGQWVNTGPCGCHMRSCGCKPYPSVNLGRSDVQTITAVKVDGATLDPSAYRLDSHQYLTRLDGSKWPCCQDLTKADTETGTWSVAITYGSTIPQALQDAAASLAAEFIKACVDVDSCRLPQRTTTVTRQGLTIDMIDPQEFLTTGRVGLYEVDLVIKAYNPNGLARRAMAWSPEVGGRAIRT